MEQIHDRVAGLDVHRDKVAACVRTPGPRGGVHTEKARFDTTTRGLAALAEWLAGHAVTLDMTPESAGGRGARRRRERSITEYRTMCYEGLNFAQRILNALESKVG